MDDDFPTAEEIADDFRDYAPATTAVTVEQLNPDNGTVLKTAENVTCLKRIHFRGTAGVESGSVPDERCRFWLLSEEITDGTTEFTVKPQDRITDADGISWDVNSLELRALGAMTVCECGRSR